MKIVGKPIGTMFPKSDITVEVCNHRFNAVCAISDNTDKLYNTSRYAAELHGFKNNIALTAFYHRLMTLTDHVDISPCNESDRIEISEYFQTDRWRDFSYLGEDETLKYPTIPDYYELTWTSEGVAAFSGAILGVAKTTKYPEHGQDMFDISGGVYGYDLVSESLGSMNGEELFDMVDSDLLWFVNNLDKILTACSYRNGSDDSKYMLITKLLGIRNSSFSVGGDSNTNYGQGDSYLGLPAAVTTRLASISKESSTRWYDDWKYTATTESEATLYAQGEIAKCVLNGGWFNNFMHWHELYNNSDIAAIGRYLAAINTAIGSNFIWSAGYGEVLEYLYFREMIERVSSFEDSGKVYIVLQKKDNFKGTDTSGIANDLPLGSLQTPISIKVDLTGTALAGKNIKTNSVGVRSLGSDEYVVDIAFSNPKEGYLQAIIEEETGATNYYDFSLPAITSAMVTSEILTVVTDLPTKCVVFVTERGAAIDTALLLERSNTSGTSHEIALTTANQAKDIYIGIITNEKQSILSNVYQFI